MSLEQQYIDHLERCFEKAERLESKITDEIKTMQGMSGQKTRHFYNNLLGIEGAKYLEIGAWMGSSTCSAMYGNKAEIVVIDNFSEFGNPKEIFLANFDKFKGDNNAMFVEANCFEVDISKFKSKFNIYLYDGHHSAECQYMALDYYLPAMDDIFIFIADDANWLSVTQGTDRAIIKNKLEALWIKEILLTNDNKFTNDQEVANKTWWNGIAVYLLKKTQ